MIFVSTFIACLGTSAALARGASKALDLQTFVTAFHAMCHELHIGPWIEWCSTDHQLGDELSRLGTSPYCAEVQRLHLPNWSLYNAADPSAAAAKESYLPLRATGPLLLAG